MTSLLLDERIDRLQAQRAAQWLEILRAGRSRDAAAFAAWCRESPVHIREFLEATWLHHELTWLNASQSDVDALLREAVGDVARLPHCAPVSDDNGAGLERGSRRTFAVAACAALAVMGLGWLGWQHYSGRDFSTQVGEQRTVQLADASIVKLNTDSQIKVDFASDERKVELRRGEAIFKVAQDRSRPFRVHTRAAVVLAVGTQFNVYDRPEGTDVTVLEGRVRIAARSGPLPSAEKTAWQELAAGEQAMVTFDGNIRRAAHPDVKRVEAWSKRRLKFERAPLEAIAAEFNRYNITQLRITGIPPGTRFYRGIFDADDPEALAELLRREPELQVQRRHGEIVIQLR